MDFKSIEHKWQKKWEDEGIFKVREDPKKKKYYCLEMFPYPSASGLHMGHAFNYTIGDIYSRFKRMNGFNVLYPMGYDSFGLPAENAAIKAKVHPRKFTNKAISNFIKQQKALGLSYDWDRVLSTCEPEYYKWNQYFFLKFWERGLVYRKKAPVNWCPKCSTVLANEQVHNGKCWRHSDTDVEIKQLEQWFIKTTAYADKLLEDMDKIIWPERIKIMQKNWIGKSHGTEIKFKINGEEWPIFTTRPDTIYGVTFMVISAQHPRLMDIVTNEHKKEVEALLKKIKSTSEKDIEELEKEGAFTGSYAINPINGAKIPVYAGNFVIAEYGCGMVMAVPAHDQRDFEFAKKYNIPIIVVIQPDSYELNPEKMSRAYTGEGVLVNSGEFSGMRNTEAIDEITKYLENKKLGRRVVQYKLRDWLISRQRYWGTPIPAVYCDKCGIVPVPERELPVLLPDNVKFGEGNPLATNISFVKTKCPKCKGDARRETDTMDTFMDSSWYFLRFCDNLNTKEPFSRKNVEYWMPVDQYIGGAEHACMHLIYARFFVKALKDMGYLNFDEPFIRLLNQGMIHGEDGHVMSKSRGNVVVPDDIIKKYGVDSLRFFLVSIASPDKDFLWSTEGVESSLKFIRRVIGYYEKVRIGKTSRRIESKLNKTIRDVTREIENFNYNIALICIRQLFETFEEEASKDTLEKFLKLLHPICPHITEELWERLGNKPFITTSEWPAYDESKIDEKAELEEEIAKETMRDIRKVLEFAKIEKPSRIILIISEKWKYKFYSKFKEEFEKSKEFRQIMEALLKDDELKQHAGEIQKWIPNLLKNPGRIPLILFDQESEKEIFSRMIGQIKKEFDTACVDVVVAEESKESKAKNAMPNRPAIVVL